VKILLDECIDRRFAKELTGYWVKTVSQMGWAGVKDGDLLALAAKEFDIFITVDRNLYFQQNLSHLKIAVLVLSAPSNRLVDLKQLVPKIFSVLPILTKGKIENI
jgi:predicted nuclease of predicted toxin-antitoxin system